MHMPVKVWETIGESQRSEALLKLALYLLHCTSSLAALGNGRSSKLCLPCVEWNIHWEYRFSLQTTYAASKVTQTVKTAASEQSLGSRKWKKWKLRCDDIPPPSSSSTTKKWWLFLRTTDYCPFAAAHSGGGRRGKFPRG